jgi:hypothetical protein
LSSAAAAAVAGAVVAGTLAVGAVWGTALRGCDCITLHFGVRLKNKIILHSSKEVLGIAGYKSNGIVSQ